MGALARYRGQNRNLLSFDADDLRVLLFLYQQELVKIAPMVSHTILIDEAARIYQMLADRNPDLFGVIFDWSENTRLKHLSSLENSIR
ncbi:hypothetical protein CMK14_15125 [Candidatus Poribacteria bacterium]|nr:hypothetical protein [Candidatus Poribacteria bacterium]